MAWPLVSGSVRSALSTSCALRAAVSTLAESRWSRRFERTRP